MKKETLRILNDDNLIFDIKNDVAFKTVFLSKEGRGLLCEILSELLKIDYNYLYENMNIINGSVPSIDITRVKSITDIVCVVENNQFIVEMNNRYYEKSVYKNGYYLFSNYSNKAHNDNEYGKGLNTYLINIDNFDVINKNEFIYTFRVSEDKYKEVLYKNIKIINVNLDYLKNIDYTKYSKLEKLFKIFVETDMNKLKDLMDNKNIERVVRFMEKLKNYKDYIVEYDYEAFKASEYEDLKKEYIERFSKEYDEKYKKEYSEKYKKEYSEKYKKEYNEKFALLENKIKINDVKKLHENGIANKIISNVTGLSLEEINKIINTN